MAKAKMANSNSLQKKSRNQAAYAQGFRQNQTQKSLEILKLPKKVAKGRAIRKE